MSGGATQTAPDGGTPAPRPRRLGRFLALAALVLLGAAAGWFWHRPAAPPPRPTAAPPPLPAPPAEAPQKTDVADLQRADGLLREERFDLALAAYPAAKESGRGDPDGSLQYRIALCLEGLGRYDRAVAAYRHAAGRARCPAVAGAAQVGQARVWLRLGRPAEAKHLLHPLRWRARDDGLRGQPFLAEAYHLLALALAREASPPQAPGPFGDDVARPDAPAWSAARSLAWVVSQPAEKAPPVKLPAGLAAARPAGPGAPEGLVRGGAPDAPLAALIDRSADLGGLKPEWSAAARQRAEGRTASLALADWAPLDVAHALADAYELVREAKAGALRVRSQQEAATGELAAFRAAGARRALAAALRDHPAHALAPAARLELGNLDALAGDWKAAAGWYGRLLREAPRAALAAEASYNLGLSCRRLGDGDSARRAFFGAIDRAPGHRLAGLAQLRVGQTFLDDGRPREAISPLRRAAAQGRGGNGEGAVAVVLAAAHLLAGDPNAAHETLVQHRGQVSREPHRQAAAFLDALALYRLAVARKQPRLDAGELLAAILPAAKDDRLGAPGALLLGQAYRDLGMGEQMAGVYEGVVGRAPPALAAEMSFELAEWWSAGLKRAAALQLYAALAAQRGKWSAPARLRLAAHALQDNKARECLETCRELLARPEGVERSAVLQVMGRAFERLGEHARAAHCFAGKLPE